MATALEIREMTMLFPGTQALDRVDLEIESGEVHALVGQNGSGKSTLIKVLAGYHEPEPGTSVKLGGEPVTLSDPASSRAAGLRFVHQDLALVDDLDVVDNLALGRGFETGAGSRIHWRVERRRAQEMIRSLGFDFDVRTSVGDLAAAERTGIAIARALWDWEEGARLLVVDEPTAALPKTEVETLFHTIRRVRDRGVAVLYVSHRLDEVFTIATQVSVLRDGRKVGTFSTNGLSEDELVALMVGEAVTRAVSDRGAPGGDPVLEVSGLHGDVLEGIDFTARAGQVLGFAGLTGSGRDELLPLIFGAVPRGGSVRIEGRDVPPGDPRAAMMRGVAMVAGDRHRDGAVYGMTVSENLTLTDLRRFRGRAGAIRRRAEVREVRHWLEHLDVRPPDPDAELATLSGGNQQKVVIAKWLRLEPRVLLLDEPTQGVDIGAKAMIHRLIRQAADEGAAVVIASSDDEEVCEICDRALIVRDGSLAAELTHEQMTIDEIGRLQLSGGRPGMEVARNGAGPG
jgi:ribose transport system ATP-binding protein